MKSVFLAAFAAAAVLTACSSVPGAKFNQQQAAMPSLAANQGRVYFYRVEAFTGVGMSATIKLDGSAVGDSVSGGYFFVDADAGSHQASASTKAVTKQLNFVLERGETKYVRTKAQFDGKIGRVVLEPVGADTALRELPSLSFTGAPKAD